MLYINIILQNIGKSLHNDAGYMSFLTERHDGFY